MFLPLVHSPDGLNGQVEARNNFYVSLPRGWQGPRHLSHLTLLFPGLHHGAGLEVEQSGQEPGPIWDASITGGGFTTVPPQQPQWKVLKLRVDGIRSAFGDDWATILWYWVESRGSPSTCPNRL